MTFDTPTERLAVTSYFYDLGMWRLRFKHPTFRLRNQRYTYTSHSRGVRCPSVCLNVRLSVHQSVCKLFTCTSSFPQPLDLFQPNLTQNTFKWREFKYHVCLNEGPTAFSGRDYEIVTK